MIKHQITGIVLAGGLSTRMKSDKGLVELSGKKFIEHILDVLRAVPVDEIIIVANNPNYDRFGYPVYKDIVPGCGPVGGIYTGLTFSDSPTNIILSCDIPFVTAELLHHLIAESKENSITIPIHNKNSEPLCGIYKKECVSVFADAVYKGHYKLQEIVTLLNTKQIDVTLQPYYTNLVLANINSPEELQNYKKLLNEN
ncbi:MAG: molybdenum cofactor guanylyltransferase [Bacteroidia bacterium]|nr:molybdenum cofactor guanylyltransferase [Bacteroidia bacterium]